MIDSDIGRPISDLAAILLYDGLVEDARTVLRDLVFIDALRDPLVVLAPQFVIVFASKRTWRSCSPSGALRSHLSEVWRKGSAANFAV